MKIFALIGLLLLSSFYSQAQENTNYQKPSKEILDLAIAPLPPYPFYLKKKNKIVLLERKKFKTIADMAEKEIRLAGLRLNPSLKISSRQRYYYGLSVQNVGEKTSKPVKGLPENAKIAKFATSPDESYMTFVIAEKDGIKAWILNIETGEAKKLSDAKLNASMGSPIRWLNDSETVLLQLDPNQGKLIEQSSVIPTGPIISTNNGSKARNRTYQDLMKNKTDEANFIHLTTSVLSYLNVKTGVSKPFLTNPGIYSRVSISPDNEYILVDQINQPFSYIVPYYRFPSTTKIYNRDGKEIQTILNKPLIEELPRGRMSVQKERRSIYWRADKPASLRYTIALDGGDPEKEVSHRDAVYQLDAPFSGDGRLLIKTIDRFYAIDWGNDGLAIAYDYWWNNRNTRTYVFNPSKYVEKDVKIIFNRNYQDVYSDPGEFITEENKYNRQVLVLDDNTLYLDGEGQTKEGKRPFISSYNLENQKSKVIFRIENKNEYKRIRKIIDIRKGTILTSVETPTTYTNYYIENIKKKGKSKQVSFFENPFKSFEGVTKELVKYKRKDGVQLSATMYLPAGYDKTKKERLPMLMWAYPKEFKDKSSAGQVSGDPNEFNYIWYGSPLFWASKGYIVLDDAAFPIIGEGDKEPNDDFINQLVANAEAGISFVDSLGYVDKSKVAVGGHSYGAFMTANLLTHCDLFAAGIARSGAYNRTLTPFGFQSEERSYWEAPEIYYAMSPFMHADKMKHPLLLIHGSADNNSGTYPMQSERYFNALKGNGATARLVMLPLESHGYSSEESVLHMLWEQEEWLKKYLGK
jgi:dipeptidyl aminopeptidase/acylaminoacyl peptidase